MFGEVIQNKEQLDEEFREEDHMEQNNEIWLYLDKLKSIEKSGIVWLIWPFWCWKTTFINQVRKKDEQEWKSIRINFEARKYPNRENLWENFILDLAWYLNENQRIQVQNQLAWRPNSLLSALIKDWIEYIAKDLSNLKEYLFDKKKRELDVIEECLKEILITLHTKWDAEKQINSTIYIVVEDIDRSGNSWTYFLETLNYFLKRNPLWEWLKTLVIATIWSKEFIENKDSYMKSLDYIHGYPIVNYKYKSLLMYFINKRYLSDNIIQIFDYVWTYFSEQFTTRTLKSIIRELNIISQIHMDYIVDSHEIWVILGILTAKHLMIKKWEEKQSYLDSWKENWWIIKYWDFFQSYFYSVYEGVFFTNLDRSWTLNLAEVPSDFELKFCPTTSHDLIFKGQDYHDVEKYVLLLNTIIFEII